jgi:hypothetical protein
MVQNESDMKRRLDERIVEGRSGEEVDQVVFEYKNPNV